MSLRFNIWDDCSIRSTERHSNIRSCIGYQKDITHNTVEGIMKGWNR